MNEAPRRALTPVSLGIVIGAFCIFSAICLGLIAGKMFGIYTNIQYLIIVILLVFSTTWYGRSQSYTRSFGELFAYGFKTTAIVALLSIAYLMIFFLLFPEVRELLLTEGRTQMLANKMDPKKVEQTIEMTRSKFWLLTLATTMFLIVLSGAIGSLIGALITKKTNVKAYRNLNT